MKNDPITVTVTYNAPVDKVWTALTDKGQMKEWYFDIPDFVLKEGSAFNFYEPGDEKKYHHRGVIQEIKVNKKFQHTWTHPSHSKGESILTWELEPLGEKTKVTLTHAGIENFADGGKDFEKGNYEAGWNEILNQSLKGFFEK